MDGEEDEGVGSLGFVCGSNFRRTGTGARR